MAGSSTSSADGAAYPLQALFVPFPFVCFTLALLTDLAFANTANILWQNFSAWLLFAGLVFGGLGILAALIDLIRPRTRPLRAALFPALLFVVILVLALINSLVHAGDGWTAVVPAGLILSAVTVLFCLVALAASTRRYARLAWRI